MTKYPLLPVVAGLWMLISLMPRLLIGETWWMVWTTINYPLSSYLRNTWVIDYLYPFLYVAVTTTVNAIVLALLVGLCFSSFLNKGTK